MGQSQEAAAEVPVANKKRRVTLTLGTARDSEVFVVGTFNDWKLDEKRLVDKEDNGFYSCCLFLAPGAYEYKFRVNGEWLVDLRNPNFVPNQFGSLNSVLMVE